MNVLLGCEYTGIGQLAFESAGCDAWSCDIDPTEGNPDRHLQMDIIEALDFRPWDLIILMPPCTYMAVSGNRHYAGSDLRTDAVDWTAALFLLAHERCERVCLENPQSVIHPWLRNFGADTQYIQPWQFGHPETKKTGLSKIGLPDLVETENVYDHMMTLPKKERHKTWYASPSKTRGKDRSRSFPGIMRAMAEQWSKEQ